MTKNSVPRTVGIILITAVCAVILGAWIGATQFNVLLTPRGAVAQPPQPMTSQEEAAIRRAEDISLAFELASRTIAPSVVNITAIERVPVRRGGRRRSFRDRDNSGDGSDDAPNEDNSDPAQEPDTPDEPDEREFRDQPSQGSGVIVRQDGYILTNNHVVGDAYDIRVTLNDGREYEAHLIDGDPGTDLAVIKIDESGLTAARFADSDDIRVGQWVLAVGNPFGYDNTVTSGIVSAKGRPSIGLSEYGNYIQTDAAVNPGNSGGPLVNLRGEIIGINNAIVTRNSGNMGIAFAIPANMAKSVVRSILTTGHVVRGWIGVTFKPLTNDLAKSFGYDSLRGIMVNSVVVDGPAEAAGLHRGDIVTSLNGKTIENSDQFRNLVARAVPGVTVDLDVFRLGKERRVDLTLGERPPPEEIRSARFAGPVSQAYRSFRAVDARSFPQFIAEEVTPDLAEALQLSEESGAFVAYIDPDSPMAVIGVREGDVVVNLGRVRVRTLDDLTEALEDYQPGATVRVHREGRTQIVSSE